MIKLRVNARFATKPKTRYLQAINISTNPKPTRTEIIPFWILSAPRLGPIVRSSIISIGAESEPALSNNAKFVASLELSKPVI